MADVGKLIVSELQTASPGALGFKCHVHPLGHLARCKGRPNGLDALNQLKLLEQVPQRQFTPR